MESASHGPDGGGAAAGDRFRVDDVDAGNGSHAPGASPGEAFREAAARLGELKEYATYLVGAKVDGIKLTVTNVVVYAALGIVAGAVGVTVLVMAVVMLCSAICNALGNLFGHLLGAGWAWLGPFLFGLVILGGVAAGIIFGLKWFMRTTHSKLVAKYEDRKREQRLNYGHDVRERAREQRVAERA